MAGEDLPIAFRVAPLPEAGAPPAAAGGASRLLTLARALEGMQKEALVESQTDRTCWRLLCDEGPWLNGTDLAPFPLGYFAAGLASCFVGDIAAEAAHFSAPSAELELGLDLHFSMEGSLLRGSMAAGVDAIEITVGAGHATGEFELPVRSALERRSAVYRALRAHLPSRFCLWVNGEPVAWPGARAESLERAADPGARFEGLAPLAAAPQREPVIRKDLSVSAPAGGSAVGLQSEQKRTVHVRAGSRARPDGLTETAVQCIHPAGSRFVFLAETAPAAGVSDRAPGGYVYLSAGIAFCFMTQLGRYAQVRKLPLSGYRIVQQTEFGGAEAHPVETAVFLDSGDTFENNLKMVQMGEQTCYVHTSFRESVRVEWHRGAASGRD